MCPWDGWEPASIAFCERRICAWVVEPSNAWSNVAYVLVGAWILWRRRERLDTAITAIAVAAILLGVGSFSFHATGVRIFEVVDVSGMYLISGLGLTFALQRLLSWSDGVAVLFFAASALASSLVMVGLGNDGIVVFAVQVLATFAIEIGLRGRTPSGVGVWLVRAIVILGIALVIWLLDKHGPLCDPDNHLVTGHAVWHVLTALSLLCFYWFHERVRDAEAAVRR